MDTESLDGKFRELKVYVDRPGVEVRYPSGYFALKDDATASQRQHQIRSTLAGPIQSSDISLMARIDRAEQKLRVTGSINVHDLQMFETEGLHKATVDLFMIQQNAAGTVLDRSQEHFSLVLNAEQYTIALKTGVFFREIAPKEGMTTLRILAGDPASAGIGSPIIPVSTLR